MTGVDGMADLLDGRYAKSVSERADQIGNPIPVQDFKKGRRRNRFSGM
jgi:hypothetical protein